MEKGQDELRLQILLEEHRLFKNRIATIVSNGDRYIVISLTVIGSVVGYGTQNQTDSLNVIFFISPFLVLLISAFIGSMHYIAQVLGAYDRIIEEDLNRIAGSEILIWGRTCPRYMHNHGFLRVFYTIAFVIVIGIDAICIYRIYTVLHKENLIIWFIVFLSVLFLCTILICMMSFRLPKKQIEFYEDLRLEIDKSNQYK